MSKPEPWLGFYIERNQRGIHIYRNADFTGFVGTVHDEDFIARLAAAEQQAQTYRMALEKIVRMWRRHGVDVRADTMAEVARAALKTQSVAAEEPEA